MSIFRKRETLLENITYMGLMAAINVVFVLLTFFVPFLLFFLVLILPMGNAIVTIYCKKRYYPIYALATIGICMLVTMTNIGDTIFFVIPSLVTGFVFGLLIKKDIPIIVTIAAATAIQIVLTYPGLWLATQILYPNQEDIFVAAARTIGVTNDTLVEYIKHQIIAVIALVQEVLAFIVIKGEIGKLGVDIKENNWMEKYLPIILLITCALLSLLFAFVYSPISYIFMLGTCLFGIYETGLLILEKKKWIILSLIGSYLVGLILFVILFAISPKYLGFLHLQYAFCLVAIIVFINNYLLTHINKR